VWEAYYPAGVWACDTEFTIRQFEGEFSSKAPFPTGDDALFVAFVASAECGTFRALGWEMPRRILDLSVEFKDHTSGIKRPFGQTLLGVLAYHGLDVYGASDKPALQKACGDGSWRGKYSLSEIVDYCEGDVDTLARLLPVMASYIDLPRALLRGRYSGPAVSAMEWSGIPIDVDRLALLRKYWPMFKQRLIAEVDANYGFYEPVSDKKTGEVVDYTFKLDRWAAFAKEHNIPVPLTATGKPSVKDDVLKQLAKAYPIISPIRELRHALSDMKLEDLAVGADGFNRTPLWAFGAKTGRNQPSNTKYIFGPSVWLRGLIKPHKGMSIAYVDWVAWFRSPNVVCIEKARRARRKQSGQAA
jgi:DNA polymerase I